MRNWLFLFLVSATASAQPSPYGVWSGNWDCQGTVIGNKGPVKCTLSPMVITMDINHIATKSSLICPENPETIGGVNLLYAIQGAKLYDAGREVGWVSGQEIYAAIDPGASPYLNIYEFDLDKTGRTFSYSSTYQDKSTGRRIISAQFSCKRI